MITYLTHREDIYINNKKDLLQYMGECDTSKDVVVIITTGNIFYDGDFENPTYTDDDLSKLNIMNFTGFVSEETIKKYE